VLTSNEAISFTNLVTSSLQGDCFGDAALPN
jgi:hypothetical protein